MDRVGSGLLACAAVVAARTSSNAQVTSDVEVVAVKPDTADRMIVPVRIGISGPYHFLVDTGSQKTALSIELAAQLAFVPKEKRRIAGVAGIGTADIVMLDRTSVSCSISRTTGSRLATPRRSAAIPDMRLWWWRGGAHAN